MMNKRKKTKNKRNEHQKIIRGNRGECWTKEMNAKKLLGGIKGSAGNEIHNIDLVMVSKTQVTQDHSNNNNELCVDSNDI
jgi:hypothetical protein